MMNKDNEAHWTENGRFTADLDPWQTKNNQLKKIDTTALQSLLEHRNPITMHCLSSDSSGQAGEVFHEGWLVTGLGFKTSCNIIGSTKMFLPVKFRHPATKPHRNPPN